MLQEVNTEIKEQGLSWVWQHMAITLALRMLVLEDGEFQANLG